MNFLRFGAGIFKSSAMLAYPEKLQRLCWRLGFLVST